MAKGFMAVTRRKIVKGEIHYYVLDAISREERLLSKDELIPLVQKGQVANVKYNPLSKRLMGFPVPLNSYELVGRDEVRVSYIKMSIKRRIITGKEIAEDSTTYMELKLCPLSEEAFKRIMTDFKSSKIPKNNIRLDGSAIYIKGNLEDLKKLHSIVDITPDSMIQIEAEIHGDALHECKVRVGSVIDSDRSREHFKPYLELVTGVKVRCIASFKPTEKVGNLTGGDIFFLEGVKTSSQVNDALRSNEFIVATALNSTKHRVADELSRFKIHTHVIK